MSPSIHQKYKFILLFKELKTMATVSFLLSAIWHNVKLNLSITNLFLTQTQGRSPDIPQFKPPGTKGKCMYCKGPHPPYKCNVIIDCQERWEWPSSKGKNCLLPVWEITNLLPVNCNTDVIHVMKSTTPVSAPGHLNLNSSPQTSSQHQQPSAAHVHATLAPICPTPPTSTPHLGQPQYSRQQ